jgi:hypothetical protein
MDRSPTGIGLVCGQCEPRQVDMVVTGPARGQ